MPAHNAITASLLSVRTPTAMKIPNLDETLKRLEERRTKLQKILNLQTEIARMEIKALRSYDPVFSEITKTVCRKCRVNPDAILSRSRDADLVMPRHLIFFLCREISGTTLTRIGEAFDRDHGSVIHGCRQTENRIQTEPKFAAEVEALRIELNPAKASGFGE